MSLHAIQLLSSAARFARDEQESFSKADINKKLQDIKYLSSQKKVPKLSLRKEIIHLENQLQGILGLEERFARQKNHESIAIASLKQQISALKNKLYAVEDLELDKKVDHLSFLLGEHLARREIQEEVAWHGAGTTEAYPDAVHHEEHTASIDVAKKVAMLQKRLEALKRELELNQQLETKKPEEVKLIEAKIQLFEQKLHDFLEQHSGAVIQEVTTVEVPASDFEVKHKMLFPQVNLKEEKEVLNEEEMMEIRKQVPLPPPPRMRHK